MASEHVILISVGVYAPSQRDYKGGTFGGTITNKLKHVYYNQCVISTIKVTPATKNSSKGDRGRPETPVNLGFFVSEWSAGFRGYLLKSSILWGHK
jgi:hypothetical protein